MFSHRFQDLQSAIASCQYTTLNGRVEERPALFFAFEMLAHARAQNGIVYVIGNGGSAGIASHFSTDLIKSLKIPSQTLYDSNLMTCIANDYGYEEGFSYPLGKLLKPQDMLVAISSSGKSPNIVKAAETAIALQVPTLTLSGFSSENPLRKLGQLNFWIDRRDYGLVETSHFFLLHTIIDLWNQNPVTEDSHAKIFRELTAKNQVSAGNR